MDITWSMEKNVNYDSCTESIRKNSQDKDDIYSTPKSHVTCDMTEGYRGSLTNYASDFKFKV